ncbi:saccharopine dehydrogenase NADP-binding domain-containing protein [Mammaliicoccus sciuri]|uniref:saccharopine dehydrogenase NADP-binding domain-containing protein n=1 Tax=Mammaliicoccus sciuri TaxID=1296 RepID=UPI0021D3B256|nr:saccharopine dehydrogenase NADP-binding domain-containing protein [Mammaliicoccus sciuri]UXV32322.1 saccharopine dehydrogenase NADP-binding domain-containing protein [Mammaliicoccus sciuri]
MSKQIGILGGNGALGSRLTKLLSEHKNVQIKVSTRTENFTKLEHHQIEYVTVSLDSVDDLKQFINGCDIVVNCTGYYNKYIIECCSEYHAHYVDTSGELNLVHSELELDEQLKNKRLSAVQFVGVNPGLTEVLIAYCKACSNVEELELYFSGVGILSKSAVLEMIETSEPPYSYSQMYIKNGNPERLDYMMKEANLMDNERPFNCVPIINHHFINCIQHNNISKAYFYNAFADKNIIYNMVEAKLLHQNNQSEKAISILMDAFKNDNSDYETYTLIKLIINNKEDVIIQSKLDWNDLTAISVYYTVHLMMNEHIKEYGIKALYEAIDVNEMVDLLKENPEIIMEINE